MRISHRQYQSLSPREQQDYINAQVRSVHRPEMMIDHIDGDPRNNDPANLRLVTPPESFGTVTRKK